MKMDITKYLNQKVEYKKKIKLLTGSGTEITRFYDKVYCVDCGGLIEAEMRTKGGMAGSWPSNTYHANRVTHGQCGGTFKAKKQSKTRKSKNKPQEDYIKSARGMINADPVSSWFAR